MGLNTGAIPFPSLLIIALLDMNHKLLYGKTKRFDVLCEAWETFWPDPGIERGAAVALKCLTLTAAPEPFKKVFIGEYQSYIMYKG